MPPPPAVEPCVLLRECPGDRVSSGGRGAAGSAPHWQCGGQGFESPRLHPKRVPKRGPRRAPTVELAAPRTAPTPAELSLAPAVGGGAGIAAAGPVGASRQGMRISSADFPWGQRVHRTAVSACCRRRRRRRPRADGNGAPPRARYGGSLQLRYRRLPISGGFRQCRFDRRRSWPSGTVVGEVLVGEVIVAYGAGIAVEWGEVQCGPL
jgi:hypothetical protein